MAQLCFSTLNHSAMYPNPVPLPDQFRAAAEAGFTYVSPDPFALREWSASGAAPSELADVASAAGVICYEFPGLWINGDDDATISNAELMATFATALGVEWVELMVTAPVDDAVLREHFRRICDRFGGIGVGVAIEFAPYTPLAGIDEACDLAHSARSEAKTGILVDTWHFFNGKNSWDDLDALALDDLALVQMSDGPAVLEDKRDGAHRRSIPGDGEQDLTEFARRVRGKGWDGTVVLEVLSDADRELPVTEFARRCLEGTLPYWS